MDACEQPRTVEVVSSPTFDIYRAGLVYGWVCRECGARGSGYPGERFVIECFPDHHDRCSS